MISVADCWSRMLSRFAFVTNDSLDSESVDEEREERDEDPAAPEAAHAGRAQLARGVIQRRIGEPRRTSCRGFRRLVGERGGEDRGSR